MKKKTPRQIIDMIKRQTKPKIWSKDLRDWYVAEIVDLVVYNREQATKEHKAELKKKVENIKKETEERVIKEVKSLCEPYTRGYSIDGELETFFVINKKKLHSLKYGNSFRKNKKYVELSW